MRFFFSRSDLSDLVSPILLHFFCFFSWSYISRDDRKEIRLVSEKIFELHIQVLTMIITIVASIGLIWYSFVFGVSALGVLVVRLRNTAIKPRERRAEGYRKEGVTILRPMKGIDYEMEACLKSAFEQEFDGPLEIILCVESEGDAAIAVAKKIISEFENVNAKLLVSPEQEYYGVNPKVNNLAKGFIAAQYDIVWVLDSNVFVSKGALQRAVEVFDHGSAKVVHHVPMSLSLEKGVLNGSKLDEMFMLTAHSKMYSAINFLAVDACVMGKSNLYRISDLDNAVAYNTGSDVMRGYGIRHFARYIGEDNMIAKYIWDHSVSQGVSKRRITAMTSDSVVQPLTNFSVKSYCDRRIRWLRVRKYMVLFATLIEPTTECLVSGIIGALAAHQLFRTNVLTWYMLHVSTWCVLDYYNFHNLLRFANFEMDENTPSFVTKYYNPDRDHQQKERRNLGTWLSDWLIRELLALPIWAVAMCGQTIYWRNRPFKILSDLSTIEL